ncbi:MAG: DsrE family protein [Saprospiraceae bacterium]|nr:DsrE family protein [Saprospiraceae bacterium]MCF8251555.1 DsrE family protein [Saprospiraceae bacterium]MCF8280885.1 DsrE family protein [Bacteroidales bacterium]MCF8310935.1 DsrE family protein [Saprospiraceae bacterium]MCF8439729.1 DsrE family protein [Saprospiraceae bacterium]
MLLFILSIFAFSGYSQTPNASDNPKAIKKINPLSIGIVISTSDPETVWNTFRLANYSVGQGDTVSVFLLGKAVESPTIVSEDFDVMGMMETYSNAGGKILACGTCLKIWNTKGSELCPVSSLSELYAIIKTSEIVLTF